MSGTPQTDTPAVARSRGAARWPFILAALTMLLAVGWYYLDRRYRPVLDAGPMVQINATDVGNGSNALSLVWRSRAPANSDGFATRGQVSWHGTVKASAESGDASHDYCRAAIPNLAPDQQLSYAVANPGFLGRWINVSPILQMRSPPTPDKSYRFLAFGDSGNGSNTQRLMAERMVATNPDLVIHLGDLIYPAGAADDYKRNFFDPYRELLARVPFMPTLGNHDVATARGQPFLDVFDLPQNGPGGIQAERNFYFDYGCARFVGLDTNRAAAKENGAITEREMAEIVAPWLRRVLCDSKAKWKFVYFHHPPYTGSTHSADQQKYVHDIFVPVFDGCGVDVVFSGHNHLYERTKPIRGDKIVPVGQGVVYIVSGAAGVSRYPEDEHPPAYIEKFNSEVFSFTQIDLSPTKLELKQLDQAGKAIDELIIQKPESTPG